MPAQHWLLVRGGADHLLPERVDPRRLQVHSSTRRPSLQRGDLALCYASGWQAIFAVVEITGDPQNDHTRERWQWRVPIRPLQAVARLDSAPPVEAAGVFPRSLGRHSYIRLSAEQFELGRAALNRVTRRARG
ncbi:MAG TPA: hypothetical protein VFU26_12125 [Gaiellaceae bacterium]|nr:hypothetical protein [Gaiellaceae bacterium]